MAKVDSHTARGRHYHFMTQLRHTRTFVYSRGSCERVIIDTLEQPRVKINNTCAAVKRWQNAELGHERRGGGRGGKVSASTLSTMGHIDVPKGVALFRLWQMVVLGFEVSERQVVAAPRL